ncbi:nuclear transport factor 2 family protein [Microbacterium timonense]|uniref:nuclear transport factor 2 family protein n=1 Tax=Microbacterium timonense TaxID=2086576 RepID=UPI000D0E9892|nr:ketosteroid isomerase [Microbacterium timonense]
MSNRDIVTTAFDDWAAGRGHVSRIFAPDMTWEIVGRSAAAGRYASARQFVDEVLTPFGRRFGTDDPFRPVAIRGVYVDDDTDTVIVLWEGRGTTVDGTVYENTYAWVMRLADGLVVDAIAFFDSIAFDELWNTVTPRD